MKCAVYLQCVTRMKWLSLGDDPDSASGSIFNCGHNSKAAWQIYMEHFVYIEPLSRKIHFGRIRVTCGGIRETVILILILWGKRWKHGPHRFLWICCGRLGPWKVMFQSSWFCRTNFRWWQNNSKCWGPSYPQSFIFLFSYILSLSSWSLGTKYPGVLSLSATQNETMCKNNCCFSSTHCMSPSPPSPPGCSDHAGHGPHHVHAACQHDGPYHPADEPSVPGHYRKCEYSLAVPKRRLLHACVSSGELNLGFIHSMYNMQEGKCLLFKIYCWDIELIVSVIFLLHLLNMFIYGVTS